MSIFSGQDAADTFLRYHNTISKENDRGAVLVAAALLDSGLEAAIKKKLVPVPETQDLLFNNGNSSLSTFSTKIELSFRLGLITESTKKMLHIFRKLRNDFAHSIETCTFAEGKAKDRIKATFAKNTELYSVLLEIIREESVKFSSDAEINAISKNPLDSTKGIRMLFNFFFALTAMALSRLEHDVEGIEELKQSLTSQ